MTQEPDLSIGGRTRTLLKNAIEAYRHDPEAVPILIRHLDRLDGPLRVALAGRVKAGKSTLLNALVGEQIAPTDSGECTKVVTWYRAATERRITVHSVTGRAIGLPVITRQGGLVIELNQLPLAEIDRVTVDWPAAGLRAATLIDTPGTSSTTGHTSARSVTLLSTDEKPSDADAVVYLMRHLHTSDLRLLESFHTNTRHGTMQTTPGGNAVSPINSIAVLSRADEIGAGRIDALQSAKRIARRYRDDRELSRLCQTVVPVAGLLAQTGRTLRAGEFATLLDLTRANRHRVEASLLSVDRFTSTAPTADERQTRADLLSRFGLYGIRLALTLIRQGYDDLPRLAGELVRRSGLEELQQVLATQFTERAELLKSRSALLAVNQVLRTRPNDRSAALLSDLERIYSGAHEFAELRLLSALRSGALILPQELNSEALRLLGWSGRDSWARLALEPYADAPLVRRAALATLDRWRRTAENPMSRRAEVQAAQVIIRSCEGMLAELPTQRSR
ncbi:GTP-binding protein [Pseudonocardiaceae bacterium YIM PH 21723]|nr:GTP-binding protein [Pseudonocardiaceae bacterium YIM PH 21723]